MRKLLLANTRHSSDPLLVDGHTSMHSDFTVCVTPEVRTAEAETAHATALAPVDGLTRLIEIGGATSESSALDRRLRESVISLQIPRRSGRLPRDLSAFQLRSSAEGQERRRAVRLPSDVNIEVLSPIKRNASALDVSKTGIRISLEVWLSAGTVCDLRITTHTGRNLYKRAWVAWTRREGPRCVSGLQVMGSLNPPTSKD